MTLIWSEQARGKTHRVDGHGLLPVDVPAPVAALLPSLEAGTYEALLRRLVLSWATVVGRRRGARRACAGRM